MRILYLSQDGWVPSGVATYGRQLIRHVPDARMLLLNADLRASGARGRYEPHVATLDEARSHDPAKVAAWLHTWLPAVGRVVILPNTGDTPWEAMRLFLESLDAGDRERIRVLGVVHSDMDTQYNLAQRFLPMAPVWVGVSRRCADELRQRVGVRGAVVHALSYPIESAGVPGPRGAIGGPLAVAYVGRLEEPQKRISRLIDVLAQLAGQGVDFRATIAGDGPAREDLVSRIERAGDEVRRRVVLAGVLDATGVKRLWETCDICLLTSAYEGLPLALLEAMAAGACPVAMAVKSGLPEILQDRINARVVPQGDVSAMAAVLGELAADRGQVARLGAAARETVERHYAPKPHFQRLCAIMDELWTMPAPEPSQVAIDAVAATVASMVEQLRMAARPVVVFGAGMFGRKVVDACLGAKLDVVALVDSDPARRGSVYRGLACGVPEDVVRHSGCVVALGSMQFSTEMKHRIAGIFATRGMSCPECVGVAP